MEQIGNLVRTQTTPSTQYTTSSNEVARRDNQYIATFIATFDSPQTIAKYQSTAVANIRDSIMNNARLSLRAINNKAGAKGIAESMIVAYLKDFADYCSFSEPISETQYRNVATLVVQNWGTLKATELMIFFSRLKSGVYGGFYGRFDPIKFMGYLREFVQWRNDKIDEFDQQAREQKKRDDAVGNVTYDEWLAQNPNRKENSTLRKIFGK